MLTFSRYDIIVLLRVLSYLELREEFVGYTNLVLMIIKVDFKK